MAIIYLISPSFHYILYKKFEEKIDKMGKIITKFLEKEKPPSCGNLQLSGDVIFYPPGLLLPAHGILFRGVIGLCPWKQWYPFLGGVAL